MSAQRSSRRPSPADDAQLDFFALLADLDAAQNTALDPPAAPPPTGLPPAAASLDLTAPLTLDFDAEPAAAGLAHGGVPQRNTSPDATAEHPTSETAAPPNTADDDRPLRAAPATAAPTAAVQGAARPGLPPGPDHHPGGTSVVPSGQVARARANLAALATLRTLQDQARAANPAEQEVLAGWSGWGALPGIFDADHLQAGDPYWPILAARVIPAAATAVANHGHHRSAEAAMELLTMPPEKPAEVARARRTGHR